MATLTVDLSEVEGDFPGIAAEAVRTGKPVEVTKDGRAWVTIQPVADATSVVADLAGAFMDEYEDVFGGLAQ